MDGTESFRTCRRGHQWRGDENRRARRGCPVCFREVQRKYNASAKGKEAHRRYDVSEKGRATKRKANVRTNPNRLRIGGEYLGYSGFSKTETEAMLDGSTD